ncbi:hypothetical protein [Agrobacterium deltaense]|uniref:hypothetical protein n=1 Tax=Agrobacterium deltaense TaxID=1183412 RepID=UPI000F643CE5|nr:hypothetical protein [Agrobacterium deltaense]RRN67624.1 hypothetical protein EIQ31_22310 [Agrobacterium deltaense]
MADDIAATSSEIIVTDRAIIRYLERAHGLDVLHFRNHIAALVANGVKAGASGVTVEGVKLVFQGNTVTTVLRREWHSRDLRSKDGDST